MRILLWVGSNGRAAHQLCQNHSLQDVLVADAGEAEKMYAPMLVP
jgi:hypothetical protein